MPTVESFEVPWIIRSQETWDHYSPCLDLQRVVWGDDPRELVPPIGPEAIRRTGGVPGAAP